jgi:electron transfer flavoprotein beta subunit
MKAKRKPLEVIVAEDLEVNLSSNVATLKVTAPPVREGGVKVADVEQLVAKLKNEAKVIS